jgi:hypothetical protein
MSRRKKPFVNGVRWGVVAAIGLLFGADAVSAQALSRYRGYVLESTLESVLAGSGSRATDARTLHERPAKIQELAWRVPYTSSVSPATTDPVQGITFSFVDDALFQIVVRYDRDRTEGVSNGELIATFTSVYGALVPRSGKARPARPAAAPVDSLVIAQWETAAESLTLLRGAYDDEVQLILASRALTARARQATRDAIRLDAAEAPQRELERRQKDAADAAAAREKSRATNKGTFRP